MAYFHPHLLIEYFAQRLVDLSEHPYEISQILLGLTKALANCELLKVQFKPSVGSCILQELNRQPKAEFSEKNFPLIFSMAQICAYVKMLEKFCRSLRKDQHFLQELAFKLFIEKCMGQKIIKDLNDVISGKQLDVFRDFGDAAHYLLLHGLLFIGDLHILHCVAILCVEVHIRICSFFNTLSETILGNTFGPGSAILIKKGWIPGQGLGANGSGIKAAIELKEYRYKRGLMAEDEDYPQERSKRGRGGKKEGRGKKAHFVRFISQKELECAKNS